MGLQGQRSKDPHARDCDMARGFIQVEIEAAPWIFSILPPPILPCKSPTCPQQGQNKGQCVCFTLKLSDLVATQSAAALVAARPTWSCAPRRERTHKPMGQMQVTEQEGFSVPLGLC